MSLIHRTSGSPDLERPLIRLHSIDFQWISPEDHLRIGDGLLNQFQIVRVVHQRARVAESVGEEREDVVGDVESVVLESWSEASDGRLAGGESGDDALHDLGSALQSPDTNLRRHSLSHHHIHDHALGDRLDRKVSLEEHAEIGGQMKTLLLEHRSEACLFSSSLHIRNLNVVVGEHVADSVAFRLLFGFSEESIHGALVHILRLRGSPSQLANSQRVLGARAHRRKPPVDLTNRHVTISHDVVSRERHHLDVRVSIDIVGVFW